MAHRRPWLLFPKAFNEVAGNSLYLTVCCIDRSPSHTPDIAGIGESVAAAAPQHMSMNREGGGGLAPKLLIRTLVNFQIKKRLNRKRVLCLRQPIGKYQQRGQLGRGNFAAAKNPLGLWHRTEPLTVNRGGGPRS
jgi:hypothetical protein